jgi:hypothetical protein
MGLRRAGQLRPDITAVVFSCEDSELSRFSIETGPCVPLVPGGQSLVSALTQDGGETPALTAALHTALTGGSASEALLLIDQVGEGRLSRCSDGFVEAMGAASEESLRLADEDEARGDDELTTFVRHRAALSDAWMSAGRWPRSVVGLQNRLVRLDTAREARANGRPVFAWHGPAVPQLVVAPGEGPCSPST